MKKLTFTDYPVITTPLDSANLNLMQDNISEAVDTGWIDANETWAYASASTFTIAGDKTSKYRVDDKFKLTQTTDKYFGCTAISYTSPNTTITVDGFGLYTLANATITGSYYSKVETPQEFPRREVVLFSGTPSASVTLSETSANFDYLDIWYEGNNDGGIMGTPYYYTKLSMSLPDIAMVAVDLGYLSSGYRVRTSGGIITASGTTLFVTESGTNYSTTTTAGSTAVAFEDTKFVPKINKVLGHRW